MIITIIATVMILGIAYFYVSQGFFNSMIMAILSVLSAAIAFTIFEPLARSLDLYDVLPTTADALSLLFSFLLVLFGLRALYDFTICSSVTLGIWPDRIGGGFFGIITGMVIVGVWAVIIQMLPFESSIMTYKPYDDMFERDETILPFRPDDFILAFMDGLSKGSLNGKTDPRTGEKIGFTDVHDNLLLEAHAWRTVDTRGGRKDSMPGTFKILGVYEPDKANESTWLVRAGDGDKTVGKPVEPPWLTLLDKEEKAKAKFLIARVAVAKSCAEAMHQSNPAGGWYLLPATQFRLVSANGRSFFPVAYLTYEDKPNNDYKGQPILGMNKPKWQCVIAESAGGKAKVASLVVKRPEYTTAVIDDEFKGLIIDWVFQVPENEQFAPIINPDTEKVTDPGNGMIIFRRIAKDTIKKIEEKKLPPPKSALERFRPKGKRF